MTKYTWHIVDCLPQHLCVVYSRMELGIASYRSCLSGLVEYDGRNLSRCQPARIPTCVCHGVLRVSRQMTIFLIRDHFHQFSDGSISFSSSRISLYHVFASNSSLFGTGDSKKKCKKSKASMSNSSLVTSGGVDGFQHRLTHLVGIDHPRQRDIHHFLSFACRIFG
ncbi:MAG: hypothetical protein CM15mV74_070 [uncultured marine virus]|nr:MAG: hypothetical protein CM15mV74_070 [uncultured marine virus]